MKQGLKEKSGAIFIACPYNQWPVSQLRRYRAWVKGWYDAKYQINHRTGK